MNQQLQCNLKGHEGYPVNALCKNSKCKHPSHVCMKCLLELHKSHKSDCILIESLPTQPQNNNLAKLRKKLNAEFDELERILTTYSLQNVSQMTLSQLDQYGKHLRELESSSIRGNLEAEIEKLVHQITKALESFKQIMKPDTPIKSGLFAQIKWYFQESDDFSVKSPKYQFILSDGKMSNVFKSNDQSASVMVSPNLKSSNDLTTRIQFKIITCGNVRIGKADSYIKEWSSQILSGGQIYSTSYWQRKYQPSGMPFQAGDIIDCVVDTIKSKITFTNLSTSQSCCLETECMQAAKLFVTSNNSEIVILEG